MSFLYNITVSDVNGGIWGIYNGEKVASILFINIDDPKATELTGNLELIQFDPDPMGCLHPDDMLKKFDIEIIKLRGNKKAISKFIGVSINKKAIDMTKGTAFKFTAERYIPWRVI